MKATYIATFVIMRGSYDTVLQHFLTLSRGPKPESDSFWP